MSICDQRYLNTGRFYQTTNPVIRIVFPSSLPIYYVGVNSDTMMMDPDFNPAIARPSAPADGAGHDAAD